MQVLLRCRPDATILPHDFANRPRYRVVREAAVEIESAGILSLFRPTADRDHTRIESLSAGFACEPARGPTVVNGGLFMVVGWGGVLASGRRGPYDRGRPSMPSLPHGISDGGRSR